jgi:hypothetical protein
VGRCCSRVRLWLCPDEEVLDAAPEVEEHSGDRRTDALKQEETGTWVDVGVRLPLEGKAERNNKHHGDGDQFERVSHSLVSPGEVRLGGHTLT